MFKKKQVREQPIYLSMYQIPLSELDFNKSYCLKFVKIIVRAVTGGACPPPCEKKLKEKNNRFYFAVCSA